MQKWSRGGDFVSTKCNIFTLYMYKQKKLKINCWFKLFKNNLKTFWWPSYTDNEEVKVD